MMSSKDGVGQIIKALVTVVTLVALTGGFRVIKAALDDVLGLTRGAGDTVWPAYVAYRLITLHLIDEILDVDLHRWTPVRGLGPGMASVGFDHGVGHPLLLLYDSKAPLGKNSNYFNGLWHNLSNPSISLF